MCGLWFTFPLVHLRMAQSSLSVVFTVNVDCTVSNQSFSPNNSGTFLAPPPYDSCINNNNNHYFKTHCVM